MANKTKSSARVIYTGSATTESQLILNGQAWNAGSFLRTDTAGFLVLCATGSDIATGGVTHMALTTVTDPGNTTTQAKVLRLAADTIFESSVHHDTATSALAPQSIIGQKYGLDVSTNGLLVVSTVDLEETTEANYFWQVIDVASEYDPADNTVSDQYGFVRCKILTVVLDATLAA